MSVSALAMNHTPCKVIDLNAARAKKLARYASSEAVVGMLEACRDNIRAAIEADIRSQKHSSLAVDMGPNRSQRRRKDLWRCGEPLADFAVYSDRPGRLALLSYLLELGDDETALPAIELADVKPAAFASLKAELLLVSQEMLTKVMRVLRAIDDQHNENLLRGAGPEAA